MPSHGMTRVVQLGCAGRAMNEHTWHHAHCTTCGAHIVAALGGLNATDCPQREEERVEFTGCWHAARSAAVWKSEGNLGQAQMAVTSIPGAQAQVDAPELRPPPEHADKPLHWVQHRDGAPEIGEWCRMGRRGLGWRFVGFAGHWLPGEDAISDHRYLGPAEWDPAASRHAASDRAAAAIEIAELTRMLREADRRVTTLEADVAKLTIDLREARRINATPPSNPVQAATAPEGRVATSISANALRWGLR